jgi:small subunit ribosomal protein S15
MALQKVQKEVLMQDYGIHAQDTGSTEVQVAILTQRINELTEHCKIHHKDFSSERGLLKMVSRRRSLLGYLTKQDEAKYKKLIQRLGLRK